jgi:hypothetical protein
VPDELKLVVGGVAAVRISRGNACRCSHSLCDPVRRAGRASAYMGGGGVTYTWARSPQQEWHHPLVCMLRKRRQVPVVGALNQNRLCCSFGMHSQQPDTTHRRTPSVPHAHMAPSSPAHLYCCVVVTRQQEHPQAACLQCCHCVGCIRAQHIPEP